MADNIKPTEQRRQFYPKGLAASFYLGKSIRHRRRKEGNKQMKSDGSPETQDDLSAVGGDNTFGEEGDTSTDTPRTYTEEQMQKVVNDTLAKRGRELAAEHKTRADKAERQVTSLQAQIAQSKAASEALQRRMDELEEAKFGDNADALSLHRSRQQLRADRARLEQEKADLEKQQGDLEDDLAEAKAYKAKKEADTIAANYDGVDAQDLVDYTDGTPEKMEALAKKLGKPKPKGKKGGSAEGGEGGEGADLHPDDGATAGGLTGDKLLEKANDDLNQGKITNKRYQEIVASVRK